jgi:hypothetical protein
LTFTRERSIAITVRFGIHESQWPAICGEETSTFVMFCDSLLKVACLADVQRVVGASHDVDEPRHRTTMPSSRQNIQLSRAAANPAMRIVATSAAIFLTRRTTQAVDSYAMGDRKPFDLLTVAGSLRAFDSGACIELNGLP